jgi:hypothetical protein
MDIRGTPAGQLTQGSLDGIYKKEDHTQKGEIKE